MKKWLLCSAAAASAGLCLAQEVGQVVSSTPVMQQVAVPRQVCAMEQQGTPAQVQGVQRCSTQAVIEVRPVAYNVVYEYAGKQYSVQLPNDPGPTIQFQLSPVSTVAQAAPPQTTAIYPQPVYAPPAYVQPGYVVVAPDPYPGYYAPGYYQPNYLLPFALGLGFGIWGGGHGHGHVRGHWR